jgi:protein involved in polysaccharide export with SLBB domain
MNPVLPFLAALVLGSGAPTVSLNGAVNQPGDLSVEKPVRLRTFIDSHGGLRQDADMKKIQVKSSDGTLRLMDLTKLDPDQIVRPGDTVTVPVIDPNLYVFVNGGVQAKGPVEFKTGMDLLTVVKGAGLPDGVGKDRVKLTRVENGVEKTYRFDLDKVSSGIQANMALLPADRIEVPYMRQQASDRQLLTIAVIALAVILILR